jgi:hypothetical protein
MGDSGESIAGSSLRIGRANCAFLGGDDWFVVLSSLMEASRLAITPSLLAASDGRLRDRFGLGPVDNGGLDRELVLLSWLYPEALEDCDSDGVWYGLPIPNSAARLRFAGTGGASPSLESILGLIKLAPRGGSGRLRSGPEMEGFRCLGGDPLIDR